MTEPAINDVLRQRILQIKLLVMDCDGVLTDGQIIMLPDGNEIKSFDVRDGHGLKMAMRAGLRTAIITGRESTVVEHRARDLGINHLYQKSISKTEPFESILKQESLTAAEAAYVGDDVTDIPVMRRVGFAVTVPDAVNETKQCAHYVTSLPGGRGAVREIVELILKTQQKWDALIERYYT